MPLASFVVVVCLSLATPRAIARFALAQDSAPPSQDNSSQPQPSKQDASPSGRDAKQSASPVDSTPSEPAPKSETSEGQERQSAAPAAAPASPEEKPAKETTAAPAKTTKKTSASKSRTKRGQKKSAAAGTLPPEAPTKKVVKNGSAVDPKVQLAPSLSPQQASSQRQGTNELLASTDENLKKISERNLASDQKDMVQQIRKYMEQSKEATDAGDLDRAHNLALKASLLAEELAKP